RGGQQHGGVLAYHLERLRGVEAGRPPPGGGVDHQRAGRLPQRQLVHEGLDATGPGREVVGDQPGTHQPRSPWYTRAAAIRSTVDGWDRSTRSHAGGSGSERLTPDSFACIAAKVSGSPVSASACASARASTRRETRACAGAASRPATVTTATSRATARGSAAESTPAARNRPPQLPSRYHPTTTAAAPSAPSAAPTAGSRCRAWASSC